jgi:hypothetical protein
VFASLTLIFWPCFNGGKMTAVQSSDLAGVDYWSGTLTIAFHSGGVYEYYGVPYSEYDALMNASSHGKYFHAHIKNQYSYRKMSG